MRSTAATDVVAEEIMWGGLEPATPTPAPEPDERDYQPDIVTIVAALVLDNAVLRQLNSEQLRMICEYGELVHLEPGDTIQEQPCGEFLVLSGRIFVATRDPETESYNLVVSTPGDVLPILRGKAAGIRASIDSCLLRLPGSDATDSPDESV